MIDNGSRIDRALRRARDTADFYALLTVVDPPRAAAAAGPRPLAGVPFVAKDTIDTARVRTTLGSALFADRVPEQDADCVARMLRAGAALVGKAHTHEFAYGPIGDSAATGPARHPLDRDRITGGSSSGSASAVALGIVPVALGTDTGGSARIPAALCGVVGFKPTHGAASLDGVFPLAPSMDTIGVLGADVDIVARVWEVLGDTDTSPPAPSAPRGTPRIAWVARGDLDPVAPRVAAAVRDATADSVSATVSLPELHKAGKLYGVLQGWEVSRVHERLMATRAAEYQPDVLDRLRSAAQVTEADYREGLERRDRLRTTLAAVFEHADILALPTCPIVAPVLGTHEVTIGGTTMSLKDALLSLTRAWSVLGWPAISLPAGHVDGLPVGLQLIAAPGHDLDLITAARTIAPTLTASPITEENP